MMRTARLLLAALTLAGCATKTDAGGPADAPNAADARTAGDGPAGTARLPSWQLEDVQPLSPRLGQIYGLDTFGAKVVVVTLVEGY